MILSKPGERLYLQKDSDQTISIDLPIPLPQHQIEGIRFLYRQFKKKAPGVILNDPSGYGKCLQVVLFLNALRPVLKKPFLILTNSVVNWKQHFETWTDCFDELAVGSSNPFSKKQIFISPISECTLLNRREWGVVVLHDEHCTQALLRTRFKSLYHIWVTKQDLKEDLHTLSSIYEWLHPNQKFNVNAFIARKDNWRDVVEKALLLDACLEDFLIRRTDFLTPFVTCEKPEPPKTPPVKTTRKNKDPTGTKVKRSKKKVVEDDEDIANVNETIPKTVNVNNDASRDVPDIDNSMDVESFIRNEKPIESEGFNFLQNLNDVSQESTTVKVSESTDVDEDKEIGDNDSVNDANVEDFQNIVVDSTTKDVEEKLTQEISKDINEETSNSVIVPATEDSDSQSIFKDDEASPKNENEDDINITGVIIPETENSESSNKIYKNNNFSSDGDESTQSESKDWKIADDNVVKNEETVSKNGNVSNVSKSINGDGDKGGASNDNTISKCNELGKKKSKIDEFDEELAELEAKALKKFKGSILDSFF